MIKRAPAAVRVSVGMIGGAMLGMLAVVLLMFCFWQHPPP
jgi:hypothetical protein